MTETRAAPTPSTSLSLQTYVQIIRRQHRSIVAVVLLAIGLGMLPALLETPRYASTASVRASALDREGIFRTEQMSSNLNLDRAVELYTEIQTLLSSPVRSVVHQRIPHEPSQFNRPVVQQVGFSEIITVTVTASEPGIAADVANTYAEVFVEDRRERATEAMLIKANELRDQSTQATDELEEVSQQLLDDRLTRNEVAVLESREQALIARMQSYNALADQLDVEAALRGQGTRIVEPAVPATSPISSSPIRGGLLGLTLGTLLALALAVVIDTFQDKIGTRDDLAAVRPSIPVLAAVPHADLGSAGRPVDFGAREAYRYLRTGVRIFGLNADLRSVLVTSAVGAEGKTTTAVHLARAMADAGDRVVLVDCDLRRPSVHEHFGLPNADGLSSLVIGDATLESVTHFVDDNLAVVTSGPLVQNPTELLGSKQFARVVDALIGQADFVIVDSPPVLPVADALIAAQLVDGVIAVGRIGQVRRRAVRDLLDRLDEAGVPIVGLVANDTKGSRAYKYYESSGSSEGGEGFESAGRAEPLVPHSA